MFPILYNNPNQMADRKKCPVTGCRNISAPRRKLCDKCRRKTDKEKDPLKYAFLSLRSNAKRRGKIFDLTFAQFKGFAVKCDLMLKRGRTKTSYHIDRIDENGPYSMDNIQLLTNEQNVKKYLAHRGGGEYRFDVRGRPEPKHDNVPF